VQPVQAKTFAVWKLECQRVKFWLSKARPILLGGKSSGGNSSDAMLKCNQSLSSRRHDANRAYETPDLINDVQPQLTLIGHRTVDISQNIADGYYCLRLGGAVVGEINERGFDNV